MNLLDGVDLLDEKRFKFETGIAFFNCVFIRTININDFFAVNEYKLPLICRKLRELALIRCQLSF